ncbi:unnamed protein product, partial [marine sediment metagenome]
GLLSESKTIFSLSIFKSKGKKNDEQLRREEHNEQLRGEEILNKLCLAGKKSTGSYYRGEGIDFDGVKEIFLPYASEIIKRNPVGKAKYRHLREYRGEVYNFGLNLPDISDESFDTLVCVASGGFEPAFLAMDMMEKDSLIPVRYSMRQRNDFEVKVLKKASTAYPQRIEGKRVLVIEDWVVSGKSLAEVMRYVAGMKPNKLCGMAATGHDRGTSLTELCGFLETLPGLIEINQKNPLFYEMINVYKKEFF